jgi:tRNA (guanine-N7-)-methyltransferase
MRSFNSSSQPKRHQNIVFNQEDLPLDLEIGAGVGWFACTYAKAHPERFLLSFEHTKGKFEKFWRRYENNGSPSNLLPLHCNAISWITQCLPDDSVQSIFFMYPNPNPKNKQQRWPLMPFMGELLKKLHKKGLVHLATNEEFYRQEALESFENNWKLKNIKNEIYQGKARTHFEEKYLKRGETCFDLAWQKI